MLLLVVGVAIWYVLYSRPERVIGDAMLNAIKAEQTTFKGSLRADLIGGLTDEKSTLIADYSGAFARDAFKADLDATVTFGTVPFRVDGGVISTASGEAYVRVDNIRELAAQAIGDQPQALQEVEPLLKLIDDKWIKLSQNDLNSVVKPDNGTDSTLSCNQKVQDEFAKNGGLQRDLVASYQANQFIVITDTLANESINGVDNLHYKLRIDQAKLGGFINAFRQTELFKKYDACTDGSLSEEFTSDNFVTADDAELEVWIGRWDHTFSRVKLTLKDADGSTELDLNTDYRAAVSVDAPRDDITQFDTLRRTYEQYLPDVNASDPDTLLPGAETGLDSSTQ